MTNTSIMNEPVEAIRVMKQTAWKIYCIRTKQISDSIAKIGEDGPVSPDTLYVLLLATIEAAKSVQEYAVLTAAELTKESDVGQN